MFAEAFFAYASNPNAMKSLYPEAAKYLRDIINANSELSKYLHLSENQQQSRPYFSKNGAA